MANTSPGTSTFMRNAKPAGHASRLTRDELVLQDQDEDELALSVISSDVSKPPQPSIRKPFSSVKGSLETPSSTKMSQQPKPLPLQSPSGLRLAVHIRSSPVTPFTPINLPSSRESSALPLGPGRTRGQASAAQTPKRPPTPNALALLETQPEATSSLPKKRGRVGSGKRRQLGPTQSPSRGKARGQNQEVKRRGRPPRPPEISFRERYLQSKPSYVSYKCEWDMSEGSQRQKSSTCPAELQNMDTLRRHVFLIHGDMDPLICRFSHCKDHEPPLEFQTEEEFESHMEKKHFANYLWHLGEGCQNNGIWTLKNKPDKLPTYLFDKQGKQVTPSIADQQVESEVQHKKRRRKLRRLLQQQNDNAPSEEEWMKQMLGILGGGGPSEPS
ncbi:hypothetical protein NPX13_g6190 [Xylaria arbuscula]|uniref:C2H2-type domain-containing protein n=1 Tax=Xylaria arbuscula TaxID=114810 RepID=A0A9W8NCP8_9PEZI|nr:hypothetical protein NPX13_g6190 [Xylaria arbuscula]